MEYAVAVGRALLLERKNRKKTQVWLAETLGCSQTRISCVEAGTQALTVEGLRVWAQAIGSTPIAILALAELLINQRKTGA